MNKNKGFMPAIILAAICFVCAVLLSTTYVLTKSAVDKQEVDAANQRQKEIFSDGTDFTPLSLSSEEKNILNENECMFDEAYSVTDTNGTLLGYIFIHSEFGYAGNVVTTTGISPSGEILMVIATAASDTPKLGKEVENRAFLDAFTGLSSQRDLVLNQDVDAVASATISSTAAVNSVNHSLEAYRLLFTEGGDSHE